MAFFDSMKVNLFSEMQGIVTLEGKPVSGATVTRTAIPSNDKEYTDTTQTDNAGRFNFGVMETHLFLKLLPSNSTIHQKIIIDYAGQQYLAWKILAASDRPNGELNERDVIGTEQEVFIDLVCELTAPETAKAGAYTSAVFGLCTWPNAEFLD